MASSIEYRYKYLNKFSHARARLAAWFNHEATCSQRHRHPSINPSTCSLPASLCSSRHGLGTPGWVVFESGLLTQTQPHRHALTHAPTHTSTHIHTYILLVLQVIPTTAQSLNVTNYSEIAKFYGPFEILEQTSPVTFRLKLPATVNVHPIFHAGLLKPCVGGATSKPLPVPDKESNDCSPMS